MIQDIAPHKLDNTYYPDKTPKETDNVIIYHQEKILVQFDENAQNINFPKISDLAGTNKYVYLFSLDETSYYLLVKDNPLSYVEEQDGFVYMSVRSLTSHPISSQLSAYAAFTAMHLAKWYESTVFCSKCGTNLVHSNRERAMVCGRCGQVIYPRINPAVIVGVKNKDSILITRYKEGYRYDALVAGFVEIGETLEEAVAREVMEETGIAVKNIKYYKSQPWGIASDMLVGFFCEVDGKKTIKVDESELKFAKWVKRNDITLQPSGYSLTGEMMRIFKEGNEPA